ncbi:hypothetical protein M3Y98_00725900 [Aphelenchoides besseyi]|nr:hypothetical protein M3Y98_00725900 [Aphelenchoides besseyi]
MSDFVTMTVKMIFIFTVISLPTARSKINGYSCISHEDSLDSEEYPNSIFEILVGENCTIGVKSGLDPDNGNWSLVAEGFLSHENAQFNYCKNTEIVGKTKEGNSWTSIGVRVPENIDDFVMQLWVENTVLREYFPNPPKYLIPQGAPDLECSAFFENFPPKYESYKANRAVTQDPQNEAELPMDCNSIRQRAYFQTDDLYPEEAEFPIAFARNVFMDYRLIEIDLAALYTPHNFYCYALDAKSPPLFHKRMDALASCFPNVFIAEKKFSMDSQGHNMSYSYNQCMLTLTKPEYKWKYLVLLQVTSFIITVCNLFMTSNPLISASRNRLPHNGYAPVLPMSKSTVFVSVSRAMIDFILNEINILNVMDKFEWEVYGVDEQLMASLNNADSIDGPATFFHLKNTNVQANFVTTIVFFGVEYLHNFYDVPQLFGNKAMPGFGVISCWYEEYFRRTHLDRGLHRLTSNIYLNLPHVVAIFSKVNAFNFQVRFNRERNRLGDKFNFDDFSCDLFE